MMIIIFKQSKSNGRNNMAWVAVDKDGRGCIYQFRPKRGNNQFIPLYEYSMWMALPKGSIKKLIGRDLTWEENVNKAIKILNG